MKIGWVPSRKLDRQRGEGGLEITAVLETSGAEERRSQTVVSKHSLRERLRDRGFPCTGESVQPEDWRLVEVLAPALGTIQGALSGSLVAPMAISVLIPNYHLGTAIQLLNIDP